MSSDASTAKRICPACVASVSRIACSMACSERAENAEPTARLPVIRCLTIRRMSIHHRPEAPPPPKPPPPPPNPPPPPPHDPPPPKPPPPHDPPRRPPDIPADGPIQPKSAPRTNARADHAATWSRNQTTAPATPPASSAPTGRMRLRKGALITLERNARK